MHRPQLNNAGNLATALHRWRRIAGCLVLSVAACCFTQSEVAAQRIEVSAQRFMEELDRGLVAINRGEQGVFLSWRLLGTEPRDIGFHVYRVVGNGPPERLTEQPLTGPTNYVDNAVEREPNLTPATAYFVRTVVDGVEGPASKRFQFSANAPVRDYLSIPTNLPEGYYANDASVGDLDGDGQYEIVLHVAGRGRDNSQSGITQPPIIQAYKLDGTLMWTINLGRNVREGAHYTQFLVYDFDCDGRAELVCKTADGTRDGLGNTIGDANADWRVLPSENETARGRRGRTRNDVGKILSGPEYLTVFDGQTGAAIESASYVPQRAPGDDSPSRNQQNEIWGDNYGNRMDRFLAAVAYLDGERPSLVMCRGYYTRTVLAAWDFREGKLTQRWVFDSDEQSQRGDNRWRGQGNHSLSVADVDQDGKDEIVYGAMVVDDNGAGLYSTRLGHGDAQHTSDLDPARPGLETWSIHENENPTANFVGSELRDARTGEILFVAARGRDVGRGMAADIDPRHPGYELWGGTNNLWNAQGEDIGPRPRSQNMAIWWDGDLLRELLDGVNIIKWDYQDGRERTIFNGREHDLAANNGSKANPCLSADFLGDWREELIARTADNRELRIYVSTIPTEHRLSTLMHDAQYRLGIAWQNVGYNQPPHPGYFLGDGMMQQPAPIIRTPRRYRMPPAS